VPKPKPKKKLRHQVSTRTHGPANDNIGDGRWWAPSKTTDQGAALWSTVKILVSNHMPRQMKDALAIGIYDGELPYWSGSMATGTMAVSVKSASSGRTSPTNIVRSVIETAASMLAKNLADVKFSTNDGTWREQRRAKDLTKYVHGGLKAANFHREQQRAFIDGCLTRARGAVKFIADHEKAKVTCERVHPRELLWNELEGENPRSFYQMGSRSKETLKQAFPQHAAFIEDIEPRVSPVSPAYRRVSGVAAFADMVDVVESWHLPNGEANPGCHVLMCEGRVLLTEKWTHEWFPFAFFSWDDQNDGWGGRPLCESLIPYQKEISRKLAVYRKGLEQAASMSGAWFEETGEAKPDDVLDGGQWSGKRTYKGAPPVFAAPPAFDRSFFEFIQWDYEKSFAEAGISMLQSQGEKPAGIDAGVALREYNDITATRQVVKGQRLERQTVDAATIFVGLSRDLYEKNTDLQVLAPGTKFLKRIKWSEVDMPEDAYTIETSATSSLPSHFVGRVNSVVDMIKGGIIPKKDVENGMGLRLLSMPDLEKEIDLYAANKDLAQMQADEALYEGRYIAPEPQQDLAQLTLAANNNYLHAMTLQGVPRKNKQLLERLMSEAHNLQMRAQVQPSGAPMAAALGSGAGVAGGQPQDGGGASPELAQMTPAAGQPPVVPGGPGGVGMQPPVQAPPAMPLANPAPLPVPAVPSNNPARSEMPL
jgi:hypothetical protein